MKPSEGRLTATAGEPGESSASGSTDEGQVRERMPSEQERLRLMVAASRSIVSELSLAGVLRRVVEAAREVVCARYAALGVFGVDGRLDQFLYEGVDAETASSIGELPQGAGLLGAIAERTHTIRLTELTTDPRSVGFPAGHPVMTQFIGVPLRSRGTVFGNLYLTDRLDGADFTDDDEDLVLALAATAGVAIENARLYEESRTRQEWLRASVEISSQLLQANPSQDALEQVAAAVVRLADADIVTIVSLKPEPGFGHRDTGPSVRDERPDRYDENLAPTAADEQLRVLVARGQGADRLTGLTYPSHESLARDAIDAGRAMMIDPSVTGTAYFVHLEAAMNVGPVMACPLVGEAGARAAVVVGRRAGARPFAAVDLEMAQAFAAHAAVALELADRRADRERLMLLEDRDRIARDLHDHVIQRVFAIGLTVQSGAERVTDPVLQERLLRTVDDLDDTIRQIRQTIFELHRRPGQVRSVSSLLQQTAESTAPSLGFSPRLVVEGPIETVADAALVLDLQAVLREGLTNVARHAHATTATVWVRVSPAEVTVEVCDDGRGLSGMPKGAAAAERAAPHSTGGRVFPDSSGLVNLAARARARGGTSGLSHGAGTTLRWSVPLPASLAPDPEGRA